MNGPSLSTSFCLSNYCHSPFLPPLCVTHLTFLYDKKASSSGHVKQGISRGIAFRHPEKSAGNPVSGRNLFLKMSFVRCWHRRCVLGPSVSRREAREGGPCWLLKLRWMGTQRVQIKGLLLWLVRFACRAGRRDFCSALAALVGPLQTILFLTVHYFNSLVPIAQKAGQAAVRGRLSLSVLLWSHGYF